MAAYVLSIANSAEETSRSSYWRKDLIGSIKCVVGNLEPDFLKTKPIGNSIWSCILTIWAINLKADVIKRP